MSVQRIALVICALALFCGGIFAQSTTGTLLGIVADPGDAAVPGARVELRNTATGRIYPIRDGIPLFVSTVTGSNLKYQTLYDRIAPGYDLAERLYHWHVTRRSGKRPGSRDQRGEMRSSPAG